MFVVFVCDVQIERRHHVCFLFVMCKLRGDIMFVVFVCDVKIESRHHFNYYFY